MSFRVPDSWRALPWLDAVASAGGRVFAVGGAVRDRLLGLEGEDLDLVVAGLAHEAIEERLRPYGKVTFVGRSFGVFKWTPPGGLAVDVALPRIENSTGPGHRDFAVRADPTVPIEQDLARRDFTCNAIAVELPHGSTIDPFGGVRDLEDRVLRAVGSAIERFEEDPLRILRAAGFVARFGLQLEPATRDGMIATVDRLDALSAERVSAECVKLLAKAPRPSVGLRLLRDTGALARVLPEFAPSFGFDQTNPHHHLPLDEHVFAAVDAAAARGSGIVVRVAALLHDLGKPETRTVETDEAGETVAHYYGHEARSAELADDALGRLKFVSAEGFPADGVERVVRLVRHHLVTVEPDASDRTFRRWIRRVGGRTAACELLELWAADRVAHAAGLDDARLDALNRRLEHAGEVPLDPRDVRLDGRALAQRFGVHGPAIGKIKRHLLDRIVDGDVENEPDALACEAAAWIASGGLEQP